VRTQIVLVITGALRTIKNSLDQNLQLLPGHRSDTGLQKFTLKSTAHHSVSAGANRFDLLLIAGLNKNRHLITNRREYILKLSLLLLLLLFIKMSIL
jgi:hypothetical protein